MKKTGIKSHGKCALGWLLAVVATLVLSPGTAWSESIDLQLLVNVPDDDVISNLNPPSNRFDLVYEAGDVKTDDGSTTLGSFMWVGTRSLKAPANYLDGVLVFPTGNVYVKLTLNFATGALQGIIVGGDGAFAGVTGTIVRIDLLGSLYQFTYRFTAP